MLPSIFRLAVLIAIGLSLGGCADLSWPGLGGKNLAASAAEVDPVAARDMISKYRQTHGLASVTIDPGLERVAQDQALAMARADRLSHTVDGSLMSRLDGANMPNTAAIENVSGGYDSLTAAIMSWRQSPPHNANLLDPKMRRMGIASAAAPASKYKIYWALVMTD